MIRRPVRPARFWAAALVALAATAAGARAGNVTGTAVDLGGTPLPDVTVTVTGGGVTVTDADGRFTIPTPNVRPVALTLSGIGSQTTVVPNLDGFNNHTLTVIVPKAIAFCPSPVPPKHRFGLFRHR
jgi:hypothetical protein